MQQDQVRQQLRHKSPVFLAGLILVRVTNGGNPILLYTTHCRVTLGCDDATLVWVLNHKACAFPEVQQREIKTVQCTRSKELLTIGIEAVRLSTLFGGKAILKPMMNGSMRAILTHLVQSNSIGFVSVPERRCSPHSEQCSTRRRVSLAFCL